VYVEIFPLSLMVVEALWKFWGFPSTLLDELTLEVNTP
jgi:hypothetical protein